MYFSLASAWMDEFDSFEKVRFFSIERGWFSLSDPLGPDECRHLLETQT
jgi:hypothetical protein